MAPGLAVAGPPPVAAVLGEKRSDLIGKVDPLNLARLTGHDPYRGRGSARTGGGQDGLPVAQRLDPTVRRDLDDTGGLMAVNLDLAGQVALVPIVVKPGDHKLTPGSHSLEDKLLRVVGRVPDFDLGRLVEIRSPYDLLEKNGYYQIGFFHVSFGKRLR